MENRSKENCKEATYIKKYIDKMKIRILCRQKPGFVEQRKNQALYTTRKKVSQKNCVPCSSGCLHTLNGGFHRQTINATNRCSVIYENYS